MNTLQFPSHWSRIRKLLWLKILSGASAVWETISGNPVSFTAKAAPLKQLQIAFSPVQDLHGYDSPWPAGGGKNIANITDPELTTNTAQRIATMGETGTFNYVISFDLENASYTGNAAAVFNIVANGANNYRTAGQIRRVSDGAYLNTVTLPTTDRYYCTFPSLVNPEYVNVYFESASYGHWSGQMKNVQVEVGTAPSAFAPYSNICPISGWDSLTVYHSGADTSNPQTISISFGSTVYSGVLDVLTGVVTVDSVKVTFDGTQNWSTGQAWRPALYSLANTIKPNAGNNSKVGLVCDHFKETTPNESYSKVVGIAVDPNGYIFCVPTGEAITGAEMTTWFENNPTTVIFPLATPITIQLTPQEVESLAGDNTMWTDGDSLEVTYRSN